MTTIDYNNKKNELLKKYYGIDFKLIPDEQNVEVEMTPEQLDAMNTKNVIKACAYCVVYFDLNKDVDECKGCPMHEAGNGCGKDNSTWERFHDEVDATKDSITYIVRGHPAQIEMQELIDKFRNEYKPKGA